MRVRAWAWVAIALLAAGPAPGQCLSERIVPPVGWHRALFGNSVQVEGDVAVIADPSDDTFCGATTCSSGAVHVFRRAAGAWAFEQTLFHSRISARDVFGAGISLDGVARFAASAGNEDVAGDGAGAVYIFEHDGEGWREVAEVLPVEP